MRYLPAALSLFFTLAITASTPVSQPSPNAFTPPPTKSLSNHADNPVSASPTQLSSRLIATDVNAWYSTEMGGPLVAGHYLLWTTTHDGSTSINGFDLNTASYITITEKPAWRQSLTSDGHKVVWVEGDPEAGSNSIKGYDLTAKRDLTLAEHRSPGAPGGGAFMWTAVDGNMLYYSTAGIGNWGLYRLNLASGNEELLAEHGAHPVAGGGAVFWLQEAPYDPPPTPIIDEKGYDENGNWTHGFDLRPRECHIHMLRGGEQDRVIATLQTPAGSLCGSSVTLHLAGDILIWSYLWPEPGSATAYNWKTNIENYIPHGLNAVARDNIVVGSTQPSGRITGSNNWSLRTYDLSSAQSWTILESGDIPALAWGITEQKEIVFTKGDQFGLANDLLLMALPDIR